MEKMETIAGSLYAAGVFFFFFPISAEYSLCYRIYYHLGFKDMKTKVQKEHPTCSRVTTGQPQADG